MFCSHGFEPEELIELLAEIVFTISSVFEMQNPWTTMHLEWNLRSMLKSNRTGSVDSCSLQFPCCFFVPTSIWLLTQMILVEAPTTIEFTTLSQPLQGQSTFFGVLHSCGSTPTLVWSSWKLVASVATCVCLVKHSQSWSQMFCGINTILTRENNLLAHVLCFARQKCFKKHMTMLTHFGNSLTAWTKLCKMLNDGSPKAKSTVLVPGQLNPLSS